MLCVPLLTELHGQTGVKGTYFRVGVVFITSCNTISSGDIFWVASISLWMTVHRLIFRSDSFDPSSETRKPSSYGSRSVRAFADTE